MSSHRITARLRSGFGAAVAGITLLSATGCDSFFEVETPNVIEASSVDPVADGTLFSRSAFTSMAQSYPAMIVYTAWFTAEAWVGDTFPTRNEYGRRLIDDRNGTHSGEVWFPLVRAIAQAEQVQSKLAGAAGQELNVARAAFASGFGMNLMAEAFCTGTFAVDGEPGPELQPNQIFEAAVVRFDRAIAEGSKATGAEATGLVNAARVGRGRALLGLGRGADAAGAVASVPANFVFNAPYVDDPGNRGRLGNGVYSFSAGGSREALVVPPSYRAFNDPRITFADAGRFAQDGTLRMWTQTKYGSWSSSIPMASGLEAQYIAVEGRKNAAEMLTFVNERRAAGNQAPLDGGSVDELLAELMAQSSRDFWLQSKRMGDWRRNGAKVPGIIPQGDNYYKPSVGTVSNDTCFPMPEGERTSNPNIN